LLELKVKKIDKVWFGISYIDQRVEAMNFGNSESELVRSLLNLVPFNEPFQINSEPSPFADGILSLMKSVYDGKGTTRKISFDLERLPTYTQRVLRTVYQIPLGYVTSYGGVADAAGGGARAVGNVMAANPFAPIIPCHRVVKSNLGLGGYGGGLKTKLQILQRETQGFTKTEKIPIGEKSLQIFPVEFVLRKLKGTILNTNGKNLKYSRKTNSLF
jgi:O-6-methylguanine DNA methyltransferase